MKVRKAVIPAAGFGTRFLPATKATPKEMLNIVDKPAIQYVVEEALLSGIEEILIITTRNKTAIENHFDTSPELDNILRDQGKMDLLKISKDVSTMANISYKRQKDVKGLGAAVLEAKTFIGDEPFAVLLADDIIVSEIPALKQLIKIYNNRPGTILGVQSVPPKDVCKYGIISGEILDDRLYKVSGMIEKPSIEEAPTSVAALGRYVLSPNIFEVLEKIEPGKNGEIQLTDALLELSKSEEVYAYDFQGTRYDTGSKLGYLKASVALGLKHPEVSGEFKAYLKAIAQEF